MLVAPVKGVGDQGPHSCKSLSSNAEPKLVLARGSQWRQDVDRSQ
jgi:hypothetical protein